MFDILVEKIVKRLIDTEVIDDCDREIYFFGMQQFLSTSFGFLSIFVIMLIMGEVLNGILFIAAFSVLRQYAGGYHANTKLGCYMMSLLSVFTVLIAIKYISIDSTLCLSVIIVLMVLLLLISPVEAINKPLDQTEKVVYRRRAIIITLVEFIAAVLMICFGFTKQASSIMFAYGLVLFALLMGKFSLRLQKNVRGNID